MDVKQFAEQILQTAKRFRWLSVGDVRYARNRVKIRLTVDGGYIDIFYNSETGRISYVRILLKHIKKYSMFYQRIFKNTL